MKASLPRKFKTLREKNGAHRRSKSSEPGHKVRPLSGEAFFSYFKNDAQKQAAREEAENIRIEASVDRIATRVKDLGLNNIPRDHMRLALLSPYSEGDVDTAIELIQLQQQAFSGTVLPYNPAVEMLGAENHSNVTCYLDALLFAMYARLEAFDCMLKTDQLNDNQRNLAALIRLWVNMLRTGKLIRTDMTERLQEALASCGWPEARYLEQQDTSEAFAFITETLQLPLLTLQVDLFHQGRRDADDHKVVYERLLNLAVPSDPQGKGVKLEDCLEDYFNTRVDVLRDSLVEKKGGSPGASRRAMSPGESIRIVPSENESSTTTPAPSPAPAPAPENNDGASSVAAPASIVSASTDATIVPRKPEPAAAKEASIKEVTDATKATEATEAIEAPEPLTASSGDSSTAEDSTDTDTPDASNTDDSREAVPDTSTAASVPTEQTAEAAAETEKKPTTTASPAAVSPEDPTNESFDHDPAPVRRWTMLEPYQLTPDDRTASSSSDTGVLRNSRTRSASLIQRIVLEDSRNHGASGSTSLLQQFKRQGSTMIKAVTIPAWQFFRLIPWHSTSNNEPQNDVEVVRQFSKRPVVGICLKRYTMNKAGQFLRQNTYIDIPDSLRLPYFMMGENGVARSADDLSAEYKLVLQSVVCHRGASLHSGHYIAFARVAPKVLTGNRRHNFDPPPDYEEEQWVKFDDLDVANRVSYVGDIKAALKAEMPYLLFYQIVPMVDISPATTNITVNEPPSYKDSTSKTAAATPLQADRLDPSAEPSNGAGSTTTGPSVRFSSEIDRPVRASLDESTTSSIANAARKVVGGVSRRGSAAFANSIISTPVITPEGGRSPVIAAVDEPTTAQRLSKAAARLTGKSQSRSRPPSQTGDGRMSLTMSRLGGLVRASRETLRRPEEESTEAAAVSVPAPTLALTPAQTAPATAAAAAAATTTTAAAASSSDTEQSQEMLTVPDGTTPVTAAAATPAAPPLLQLDGQDERGRHQHHHHHHHRHHSHMRRKDKEADIEEDSPPQTEGADATATAAATTTATGASKGKDKERPKSHKLGVPERECAIM